MVKFFLAVFALAFVVGLLWNCGGTKCPVCGSKPAYSYVSQGRTVFVCSNGLHKWAE